MHYGPRLIAVEANYDPNNLLPMLFYICRETESAFAELEDRLEAAEARIRELEATAQ